MEMTPEPFVTADEVADHLKIKRRQVLEMTRANDIPGYPICLGRRRKIWRFKLAEVDQALASRKLQPVIVPTPVRKATSNTLVVAIEIDPPRLKAWMVGLGVESSTRGKYRSVMSGVYNWGQCEGLIPRGEQFNPCRYVTGREFSQVTCYEAIALEIEVSLRQAASTSSRT
jgi:excisionase family DNA binding protein